MNLNAKLTLREGQIQRLIVEGKTNKEIAATLGITEGTAKIHIHSIYTKLGVAGQKGARHRLIAAAQGRAR